MKAERLLDAIGNIDDELICEKTASKKSPWRRWGAAVACLCLLLGGLAVYGLTRDDTVPAADAPAADSPGVAADSPAPAVNCIIHINGKDAIYSAISFDERIEYGLVPEDAIGLDEETQYIITQEDLGEPMGTVTQCADAAYIGRPVYHFVKYPQDDQICIIDTPYGYEFYVFSLMVVPEGTAQISDGLLDFYGLPDSLVKMEVRVFETGVTYEITEEAAIAEILQILSGKPDLGQSEQERRFADFWQQTYENDDVYFDEDLGSCKLRIVPSSKYDPSPEQNFVLFDQVEQLRTKDLHKILITSQEGYEYTILYYPHLRLFQIVTWADGNYGLSEEETQRMNTLLDIQGLTAAE